MNGPPLHQCAVGQITDEGRAHLGPKRPIRNWGLFLPTLLSWISFTWGLGYDWCERNGQWHITPHDHRTHRTHTPLTRDTTALHTPLPRRAITPYPGYFAVTCRFQRFAALRGALHRSGIRAPLSSLQYNKWLYRLLVQQSRLPVLSSDAHPPVLISIILLSR